MHVKIHAYCLVLVRVVTLRCEDQNACKLGISIEGADAGDHVTIEDLEGLSSDDDLTSDKTRPS